MGPLRSYNYLPLHFLCIFLLVSTGTAYSSWDPIFDTEDWINHGGDLHNRRFSEEETKISRITVSALRLKWELHAGRDTSATPAIFDRTLYFPSWNGYLYAVNSLDGSLIWKQKLQELSGLNATGFFLNVIMSRATPTIADDLLIVGINGPAAVIAIERLSGRLVWSTRLDAHPSGVITMSGTNLNWLEAGPGGVVGGGTWGAATDERRVYTNIVNSNHKNFSQAISKEHNRWWMWPMVSSLLFGGSTNPKGPIYAIDIRTVIWANNTGVTVYGGMSVSNGHIYLGNGYRVGFGSLNPSFTAGTSIFAFCLYRS
ncbi:hypothetical protein SLE2022_278960 [Rubroshorea leprosula]